MRYMLLNKSLLIDLDQFYAFEIESSNVEKPDPFSSDTAKFGYCIVCHQNDFKSVYKIYPNQKTSRTYCVNLLERIAKIRTAALDGVVVVEDVAGNDE